VKKLLNSIHLYLKSPESAHWKAGVEISCGRRIWGELSVSDVKISRIGEISCITEVQVIVSAVQLAQLSKHLHKQKHQDTSNTRPEKNIKILRCSHDLRFINVLTHVEGGSLYRSTGQNINGPNINELQINCSIDQQKPVNV
jgi:hypothetical protein